MTDADFKRANPKATQTIDIESFVELDEIDPVFFERAYYLLPNKGGQKGYQLLVAALKNTRKVAVAKIILHTKQHLAAIIARGDYLLLELLHFAADVRDLAELGDWRDEIEPSKHASREVEMAESLIESMTTAWRPEEFTNTYRDDIMKIVREKVKAGKATEITQDFETRAEDTSAQVVDLMPLLRKSLETDAKIRNPQTRAIGALRRRRDGSPRVPSQAELPQDPRAHRRREGRRMRRSSSCRSITHRTCITTSVWKHSVL